MTDKEPQTNPDALVTLRARIDTKDGPRSIVMRNVSVRDTSLIAGALTTAGHYAEYEEGGAAFSMVEHLAARRRSKLQLVSALVC